MQLLPKIHPKFFTLGSNLDELTKKDAFVWSNESQMAFEELKRVMCTYPCLTIPNFSIRFTIVCDASKYGIGAVIMEEGRRIAFESRKLTPIEQSFSVYDREMLAIMHALARFKQYLVCVRFVVKNDLNNLKYFLEQSDLSEKQQQWVSKLQSYDFAIEYIKETWGYVPPPEGCVSSSPYPSKHGYVEGDVSPAFPFLEKW